LRAQSAQILHVERSDRHTDAFRELSRSMLTIGHC
jgi:hypothetical protein